jgi:hypothetical protein
MMENGEGEGRGCIHGPGQPRWYRYYFLQNILLNLLFYLYDYFYTVAENSV